MSIIKLTTSNEKTSIADILQNEPVPEIELRDLQFAYKSRKNVFPVLENVSVSIKGAQLVSILGPNGVGKSTLIHCMNKILEPTDGAVIINGHDIRDVSIKDLAKVMGYVPYTSVDNFPLSVTDTVLMGRHPHSKWGTLDEDLRIVHDMLCLIGIEDLADRNFNELSAGQHQKVMLARGLAQEPRIMFLDEPTSNLDVKYQLEITKMLRRLSREKNMLVIMISHDINIAAKYSDNIIMMHDGGIFALGKPVDVITAENIKHVYDVDAKVIMDEGRPHIVMIDSDDTDYENDHEYSVIATKSGSTYKGP